MKSMEMVTRLVLMILVAATLAAGCRGVTARMNRRAESHVRYHAKRALRCEEAKLTSECVAAYGSGECYEYEVSGCNAAVRYRNVPGEGWTPGS
jgi:hypothetical protein